MKIEENSLLENSKNLKNGEGSKGVKLIKLPFVKDDRGNLTFIQNCSEVPFEIQRVFWMYDVPGGEERGGHAFRTQNELIVALSGSFVVEVHMGKDIVRKITLNRPNTGLFLPPMVWRKMKDFSTNSVSLHVVDKAFDPNDYIRDFNVYLESL